MEPAREFADLFIDNDAGEFLYFLIAVGVSFGALLIALDQRYRSQKEDAAGRYLVALLGVLVAWLALGAGRIYVAVVDSADPAVLIPPLERATNALVLLLITWVLLVAESQRREVAARVVLWLMIVVIAGGYYFTVIRWEDAVDAEAFNQHSLGLAWTLIPALIAGLGMILLMLKFRFAADIPLKLMLFIVIILGHAYTLYLMGADELGGNLSGEIRVTMLVVLALLPVLIYRMVIDRFREAVGEVSGWVQTVPVQQEALPKLPPAPSIREIEAKQNDSAAANAQREAMSLLKTLGVMLEKTDPRAIPQQIVKAVAQTLKADIVGVAAVDNPNWADLIAAYDAIHEQEIAGLAMNLDNQPTLASAIELNIQCVLLPTRSSEEITDLFHRLDAQFTGPLGPAYFQPLSKDRKVVGMLIMAMPYTARLLTDEERTLLEGLGPIAARLLVISREAQVASNLPPGSVPELPPDTDQQAREQSIRQELQQQIETTQAQVTTLNAQIDDLKAQLQSERAKLNALAQAGQSDMSITQQINVMSAEREGLSQEREELVTALNHARSLFVSATADSDDDVYRQMVEALQAEKNELVAEKQRLERQLSDFQGAPQDKERLADVINTLNAEKERLADDHQRLKTDIQDAELQLAELGIEGGLLGYSQMVAHLTEERNRFLAESKRAMAERDMLLRERHAYEEQAGRELERTQQISMLEVELARLASDREAVIKQRDALKAERDTLNTQRDDWLEARIKLTEQYEKLRSQYERNRAALDAPAPAQTLAEPLEQDTRVDLDGLKSRLYEVEENRSDLEFELMRAREDIELLEKELDRLRTQSEQIEVPEAPVAKIPMTDEEASIVETMVGLAQDLRTPLTSIMGYNEVLLGESMGILGETQRTFLQRIQVNVEQLMHLIENLIRVPAIDRGKLNLAVNKIDVTDLIDDAITSSSAQYREKGLTLHLEIAEDLPDIVADRDAMHQILTRLLTNAYLASPADSAVTVQAAHWPAHQLGDDDERDVIYFAITDQGGGIREDDIRRVFARHFRAENPLIEGLGEKGAGLAVARALVEAHGGRIWAEAEEGQSTTFKVIVPVDHHFGENDVMRGRISRLISTLQHDDDDEEPARATFGPEDEQA